MSNIISWNVNGIRAVFRKDFTNTIKKLKPDILCLQEIKIDDARRAQEKFDLQKFTEYWNSAKRPGYAGTAIYCNDSIKVISEKDGIGTKKFDEEGRVQTLEFPKFYLVNAYFPNTRQDLSRLDFKMEFNNAILKHIKKLDKQKPVILCGDLNVAHAEIDLARPKENEGNAGFVKEERDWASKLIKNNFTDTFRYLHPKKIQYSWWSYRFGARQRNVGWRIDYFVVSDRIKSKVNKAYIKDKVMGSDHCPVGLQIDL